MTDPKIVTEDEWRAARLALLAREKELTRRRDAVNAERRRLSMVEIDKEYVFEGAAGNVVLVVRDRLQRRPPCDARSGARHRRILIGTYNWLDLTPRGRQEDFEQPPGRSNSPFMGWLHRHDEYPE